MAAILAFPPPKPDIRPCPLCGAPYEDLGFFKGQVCHACSVEFLKRFTVQTVIGRFTTHG